MPLSAGLIAIPSTSSEDVAGRLGAGMEGASLHFRQAVDPSTAVPSVGASVGGWVLVTDPQRALVRSAAWLAHLSRQGWVFLLDVDESVRGVAVAGWNNGALAWHVARDPGATRGRSDTALPAEYIEASVKLVQRHGNAIGEHPDSVYLVLVQMFCDKTGFWPDQPGWWEEVPYRPLLPPRAST